MTIVSQPPSSPPDNLKLKQMCFPFMPFVVNLKSQVAILRVTFLVPSTWLAEFVTRTYKVHSLIFDHLFFILFRSYTSSMARISAIPLAVYDRDEYLYPQPQPQCSSHLFLGTIKNIITAPFNWFMSSEDEF